MRLSPFTLTRRASLGALMAVCVLAASQSPALAESDEPSPSASAKAEDPFAFGVSTGAGLPGGWPNVQGNSAFWVRWGGSWHEGMVGITSRTQALSANRSSVFETSGLQLAYGLKAWNLHAGLGVSGELLREIVANETAPGQLRFHNGAGVVVEPYVALDLFKFNPFQVQLVGYYPIWQMLKSDSVGPRAMLTLWVAPGAGDDSDESDDPSPSPSTGDTSSEPKGVGPEEPAPPEGSPGEPLEPGSVERGNPSPAPSASPAPSRPSPRPTARPARPSRPR